MADKGKYCDWDGPWPVRAGFRFFYKTAREPLADMCLIFPDDMNEGQYLAVSSETGRVGRSDTPADAYLELILNIGREIKQLVRQDAGEIRGDNLLEDALFINHRTYHRIDPNISTEIISRACALLKIKMKIMKKAGDLGHHQLDATQMGELSPVTDMAPVSYTHLTLPTIPLV